MLLDTIGREFGEQGRVSNAHDMSSDMALISCLVLRTSIHCWESRNSISREE